MTQHGMAWSNWETWDKSELGQKVRESEKRGMNECCMIHLAVALLEAFLTLFHTIKTTSIREVCVVSTKYIESDIFSHVFRPFALCEMVGMNPEQNSKHVNMLGLARRPLGYARPSLLLLWFGALKSTDHTNLRLSPCKIKHINTYPLIRIKQATNLVTTQKNKTLLVIPQPHCISFLLPSMWIMKQR